MNVKTSNIKLLKSAGFYRIQRTTRTKWAYPIGVSFILEISKKV